MVLLSSHAADAKLNVDSTQLLDPVYDISRLEPHNCELEIDCELITLWIAR